MVELTIPIVNIPIGKSRKIPSHIAINTGLVKKWAEDNKKDLKEALGKHLESIRELMGYQVKNNIRVLTIGLADSSPEILGGLKDFFASLSEDESIRKNQVRIFVLGQWYDLDIELRDAFKSAMDKTKMYDNLFLNFCVKYDGRAEVLGAVQLIAKKIVSGKLVEAEVSEDSVKENLSSSYFPPPELIIETRNSYSGLLLWESKESVIHFSSKRWLLFEKKDLDEAVAFYNTVHSKDDGNA
ncbi:undecaprenyl diphosphate synthase family protein [Candidatus Woesearchaeota archaeon]|nr:undecaprenyl diphosphate synthase family protein [Candidatus Woesearchaeota archaeon]